MRRGIATAALLIATGAQAQQNEPYTRDRITIQQPMSCSATATPGSEIVALSTNGQAGPMVPFTIDPTSTSRLMSVTAGSGKAVTLLLTSTSPVVWDLRGVANGRIASIIVTGRGEQGIVGAPSDIPIEFTDASSMGYMSGACRPLQPISGLDSVVSAAQSIRGRFGRYPDRLYAGRTAIAFDLDGKEVRLPTSVDLKPADVRTRQPIDPNAPAPAFVVMKEMLASGTLRPVGPSTMSRIGSMVTPMQVERPPTDGLESPLPDNLPAEIRARILESRRMAIMARQRAMARRMSYVPSNGFIVMKRVDALPANPNGQNAYFLPSDVPAPARTPPNARLYRISIPASQLPPPEQVDPSIMVESRNEIGTVADLKVSWSGNDMTVAMPPQEPGMAQSGGQVGEAVPSGTTDDGTAIAVGIAAILACLATLGGLVWFFLRRRGGRMTPSNTPKGASRLDALEAAIRQPELKEDVRAFREEAMRLVGREGMDKDLSEEANSILRERFAAIADRYLSTRATSEPDAATALDERLSTSLREMTAKLADIRRRQDQRNVDALAV